MGIQVYRFKSFKKINTRCNSKIHFTLFTWFVLAYCLVIFPIRLKQFPLPSGVYLLESITWIPIQIRYVYGHFEDYAIWDLAYYILSLGRLWYNKTIRTRNKSQGHAKNGASKRAAKTENPVPRSFFAPKPNGNACYAGYQQVGRV